MSNTTDPLRALKDLVEQEEWFKLANGRCGYANSPDSLTWLEIHVDYREEPIRISADLDKNGGIRIATANNVKASKPRFTRRQGKTYSKSKRRSTPEKALAVVQKNFAEAIQVVDVAKAEEKRIRDEHNEKIANRDKIIASFSSTVQPVSSYNEFVLQFKVSQNYELRFYEDEEQPGKFRLGQLLGTYSQEQIQKLIDWMGSCPEAAADRLLNGK